MAIIKSFTDLEQSKKLAEILPLESADYTRLGKDESNVLTRTYFESCSSELKGWIGKDEMYPCWSLAALLEQLPYEVCDDDGNSFYLQTNKEDDVYQLVYTDPNGDFESIETDRYEHFIDACYEMITRLNELNLL